VSITTKERLVWVHTVYSRTNEQAGDSLGISPRTVEARRHKLRAKLGIRAFDKAAFVRLAAGPGFFPA
jgi:FixJ family two-component response regulator